MPNMKKKLQKNLIIILAYLYIFIGFSYIIHFVSFNFQTVYNPLNTFGWPFVLFDALLYFIAYVIINHTLIRRVIKPYKLLKIIETLLFAAILTVIVTDLINEANLSFEDHQRIAPIYVPNI